MLVLDLPILGRGEKAHLTVLGNSPARARRRFLPKCPAKTYRKQCGKLGMISSDVSSYGRFSSLTTSPARVAACEVICTQNGKDTKKLRCYVSRCGMRDVLRGSGRVMPDVRGKKRGMRIAQLSAIR